VGSFWTNFSSGNPNSVSGSGSEPWPAAVDGILVLDADLPGHSKVESEVNGDRAICALWDTVDAQQRS